jgi:LPS-assembly lipoprotein
MWWRNLRQWQALAWPARLAVVLAAAGLTAGCWQPLYGARPGPGGEGVQDKFAAVDIPPIGAPKGTPTERVAIGMRNALQFDLHNGGSPAPPIYALKVTVSSTQFTAYIDPTTGRPDSQIQIVIASYQLIELGTGKMVLNDMTIAHVDYDLPGSQQRFAASARGAMRKIAPFKWLPTPSATGLRRTSSPGRNLIRPRLLDRQARA